MNIKRSKIEHYRGRRHLSSGFCGEFLKPKLSDSYPPPARGDDNLKCFQLVYSPSSKIRLWRGRGRVRVGVTEPVGCNPIIAGALDKQGLFQARVSRSAQFRT